jgi:hypothetical protein
MAIPSRIKSQQTGLLERTEKTSFLAPAALSLDAWLARRFGRPRSELPTPLRRPGAAETTAA